MRKWTGRFPTVEPLDSALSGGAEYVMKLSCTNERLDIERLDRLPFKFRHSLMGHPSLELSNLARLVSRHPRDCVYHSSGKLRLDDDFDRASIDHKNGLTVEETIENIRTSDSYIMVRAVERDPSFRELFRQLLADVDTLSEARGLGGCSEGAMLYLFIASPNSVTPFHFDRYSTLLYQFAGSKRVWVAPPWDERVISSEDAEKFAAYTGGRPVWKPELEALGEHIDFAAGEALHIPFVSGHSVRNGPAETSISMSIIFNTRETTRQLEALRLNCALRARGLPVSRVGSSRVVDGVKAGAYRLLDRGRAVVRAATR